MSILIYVGIYGAATSPAATTPAITIAAKRCTSSSASCACYRDHRATRAMQ